MKNKVGAEFEWSLEVRRSKGVVADDKHVGVRMRNLADGSDVDDLHGWVGRRFDPHHLQENNC